MNKNRGARPIKDLGVFNHYKYFKYADTSLSEYADTWREWLTSSKSKTLHGLENFKFADFVNGTSQTFDHFTLRYSTKTITALPGDFQYHRCIGKTLDFSTSLTSQCAFIHSFPFSDTGSQHINFIKNLEYCNINNIPVCLDLAYWGIAKNLHIDLNQFPCIAELTCSLSKPFYTLENHRVGIRFTRTYQDDGISMINEVNMQNKFSMSLGIHYMKEFTADYMWDSYIDKYNAVCEKLNLKLTNTVIFGLGGKEYYYCNRGIETNNRVCIASELSNI